MKGVSLAVGLLTVALAGAAWAPISAAQDLTDDKQSAEKEADLLTLPPSLLQGDMSARLRETRSPAEAAPGQTLDTPFVNALDMQEAVSRAAQWHPTVRNAVGSLLRSAEGIDVARAGYYPQVRGGFNSEYNDRDEVRQGRRLVHRFTVSATQMIYDFGKVSGAVDKAQAARLAAQARVLLSIDEVSRETANALIELQRYLAMKALATEQVEAVAAIAVLARQRRSEGASTLSDEVQAQSREDAARATLLDMEAQVERWRSNLLYLTGISGFRALRPEMPAALAGACSADTPTWEMLPAVMVAQAERAEAQAELSVADAQSYPTVALEGSAGRALNGASNNGRRNDVSVMLNVSMPFYQGGGLQAGKRAAAHALGSADAAIAQARLTAGQSLVEARNRLRGYEQRIRALDERTRNMDLTRSLYRQQYLELGTRSLLDLLNAEQEYHQALLDDTNNRHDMRRMQMECLYHAGRMREAFALNGTTVAGVEVTP